jgi:hypothetical protein
LVKISLIGLRGAAAVLAAGVAVFLALAFLAAGAEVFFAVAMTWSRMRERHSDGKRPHERGKATCRCLEPHLQFDGYQQ